MNMKPILAAVAAIVVLGAATTNDPVESPTRTCAIVAASEVCTWVTLEHGHVTALGADIPLRLIESSPHHVEMVWPPQSLGAVPLPAQARAALGVDHLALNWEAHGHPPAAFLAPHFDFHFYNIDQAAVASIDCVDATKPATLPQGYALPDIDVPGLGALVGLCVPLMGMHAMPERDVSATDPFEASMIIGYYGGKPTFFEPMVSRAVLESRKDFALSVPPVADLPHGVRYPTEMRATYAAATDSYRLVFTGFAGA